ncbi:hypothetical protein DT603_02195 [Pseudoxanthomonas gei]|uniref:Secreted protein n=1 Tax=Pseudoxanthomonas gei TaxID=1383030 RepID=A0ABX0A839_9GAMM|nr:hypothetical protein [Pseudoxanthomonas gei]
MQLVALQHLTAAGVILSPRAMHSAALIASASASTFLSGASHTAGLARITTATTRINGVRWIVFA